MSDGECEGAAPLRSRTPAPDGPCRWVARGHAGAVTCLAVAPGGDRVLSGGADGHVRLWSRGGHALAQAALHPGGVSDLAWVSPSLAVSVGADHRAVFLDVSLTELEAYALPGRPTHIACDRGSGTLALALEGGWLGRLRPTHGPEVWSVEATTTSLLAVGGAFARGLGDRWQCVGTDGAVIAAGSLEALCQGRFSDAHLRPHPDGRRVLAVVEGIEMELYTTRALTLLDPRTGAIEPRDAWSHTDLPTPWVGSDGEPLYVVMATPRAPVAARLLAHPQGNLVSRFAVVDDALVITGSLDGTVRGWDPRPLPRAPLAGRLVEGADRRAGELCTWEPERSALHWWAAHDGRHLRSEPLAGAAVQGVALAGDGHVVVTARRPRDGGGWAGLAAWTGAAQPAWETDAPAACDGSALAAGGAHGAVEHAGYALRSVWAGTARLHDRASPHLAYGGATAVGDARVISWDTAGLVCGWDAAATSPAWRHQVDGGVHAAVVVEGGGEVALLCVRRNALWVTWLDVITGAVRVQTAPTRGALATTLTARPGGVVVAAGVVPIRFVRGDAPGTAVAGITGGYCTMVHERGRFALHQAHDGTRTVIDIDRERLTPLPADAAGDVMYQWASLGDGPDGAPWLACSLVDGEVAIVDLAHARVVRRWCAHAGQLLAMGTDATRTQLLTAGRDGRIKVWRVVDGVALGDWPGPRAAADLVAWPDDGPALWGCDPSGPWVLRRYVVGRVDEAFTGAITSLAVPADLPATAARWQLVRSTEVVVHALADGREVGRARTGVPGGLTGGALSPDGRLAVLARFDEIELVDIAAGRRITLAADKRRVRQIRFLPGDRLLLTREDARVLAVRTGATLGAFALVDAGEQLAHVAVDPTGRWLAVAATRADVTAPGAVRVHALDDGALAWHLAGDEVTALAFAEDGALLVGHARGALRVRAPATGACVARWDGAEAITQLRSLADGRLVVLDSAGTLRVLAGEG